MAEAPAIDHLVPAAVLADRLAVEVFCEVGRDLVARDAGTKTVVLERLVSDEFGLSSCDEVSVSGGSSSSSGEAFR